MAWTDAKIEELKKLWARGLSASQIADEIGDVTRNAVIGKAHRLGLKARPSPVKPKTGTKTPRKQPKPAKAMREKITILTLTERTCKWPIGHPGEPDFHFCGAKSSPGQPYCDQHAAEAYQAPVSRRDRNRNFTRSPGR